MRASARVRILVVDDEPQIRAVVRAILESAHYDIELADDGKRAIEQIDEWEPDLVITDLVMPDQEGMELIRQLRAAYPALAIIAMSGARDGRYLPTAKALGANATLEKPFDPDTLLASVRDVMLTMGRAA